jgi:hypothetical protein
MRLELLAMGPVVDPYTQGGDPFSRRDRRRVTNDGNEITRRTRRYAQYAKAALAIVERHPLDGAGEHLAVRHGGRQQRGHRLDYYLCLRVWRVRQADRGLQAQSTTN